MVRRQHRVKMMDMNILLPGLLLLGHAYMILLVLLCQTLVYREVTALFSLKSSVRETEDERPKGKDPWSKTLNWYFFAVTNYFLYGESIIYYFKVFPSPYNDIALADNKHTACSICGRPTPPIRNEPSHSQLHSLYNRVCRLRHVASERILQTAIRLILLGSHEPTFDRGIKVCSPHPS